MVALATAKEAAVAILDRLHAYAGPLAYVSRCYARTYVERVHTPTAPVPWEAQEASNVVTEDHRHEVSTTGAQGQTRIPNQTEKFYLINRAVWKISSSCAARFVESSGGGSDHRPRSLILRIMSAMY